MAEQPTDDDNMTLAEQEALQRKKQLGVKERESVMITAKARSPTADGGDSELKNMLGMLSIVEKTESNISELDGAGTSEDFGDYRHKRAPTVTMLEAEFDNTQGKARARINPGGGKALKLDDENKEDSGDELDPAKAPPPRVERSASLIFEDNVYKALDLINKAEAKRVAQHKVEKFLSGKGMSSAVIEAAYEDYYEYQQMYELTFAEKPLGFSVIMDTRGKNALVSSLQSERAKENIHPGSTIIAINGDRVDELPHREIIRKLKSAKYPFDVRFQKPFRSRRKQKYKPIRNIPGMAKPKKRSSKVGHVPISSTDLLKNGLPMVPLQTQSSSSSKLNIPVQEIQTRPRGMSNTLKMEDLEKGAWGQDHLELAQKEMLEELAKLMHETAHVGKKDKQMKLLSKVRREEINSMYKEFRAQEKHRMSTTRSRESSAPDYPRSQTMTPTGGSKTSLGVPTSSDGSTGFEDMQSIQLGGGKTKIRSHSTGNIGMPADRRRRGSAPVNALDTMLKGSSLKKRGKYGDKFRRFQISKDKRSLIWFSDKKGIEDTTVPLGNVKAIIPATGNTYEYGGETKDCPFKGQDPLIIKSSFHIIYGTPNSKKEKRLVITATTEAEATLWMEGLKVLVEYNINGQFQFQDLKDLSVVNVEIDDSTRRNSVANSMDVRSRKFSIGRGKGKSDTTLKGLESRLKSAQKKLEELYKLSGSQRIQNSQLRNEIAEEIVPLAKQLKAIEDVMGAQRIDETKTDESGQDRSKVFVNGGQTAEALWKLTADLIAYKGKLQSLIKSDIDTKL